METKNGIRGVVTRVTQSTWAPVFLKAIAVTAALVVLAVIGHVAAARAAPGASSLAGASVIGAIDRDASVTSTTSTPPSDAGAPPPAPLPSSAVVAATSPASGRASPESPVFLNHASVDELRRLPGVGPKRAEAILAHRQRHGRFHRVEDLMRVKGIGRNAVKKWRPLVRLDPPSSPDAGPS